MNTQNVMNTQEVADRLVEMCRKGQNMEALDELYADNCVSREMPGVPSEILKGKEAIVNKSKEWKNNVMEFHKMEVSEPLVAGNHFSMTMDMDVTFKDRGRQPMQEVCVYEVNKGKIVNEQFFYSM